MVTTVTGACMADKPHILRLIKNIFTKCILFEQEMRIIQEIMKGVCKGFMEGVSSFRKGNWMIQCSEDVTCGLCLKSQISVYVRFLPIIDSWKFKNESLNKFIQ